jgi:hypothetical protein
MVPELEAMERIMEKSDVANAVVDNIIDSATAQMQQKLASPKIKEEKNVEPPISDDSEKPRKVFEFEELLRAQHRFIIAQREFVYNKHLEGLVQAQEQYIIVLRELVYGARADDLAAAQDQFIIAMTNTLEGLHVL